MQRSACACQRRGCVWETQALCLRAQRLCMPAQELRGEGCRRFSAIRGALALDASQNGGAARVRPTAPVGGWRGSCVTRSHQRRFHSQATPSSSPSSQWNRRSRDSQTSQSLPLVRKPRSPAPLGEKGYRGRSCTASTRLILDASRPRRDNLEIEVRQQNRRATRPRTTSSPQAV